MKLLVCGSRGWNSPERVAEVLNSQVPRPTVLISGLAAGPDSLAYLWAGEQKIERIGLQPDWRRYGRAAGVLRNAEMLKLGPDKVLAFWDGRSRGTKNMIEIARKAGVPVEIVVMPPGKNAVACQRCGDATEPGPYCHKCLKGILPE